MRTLASRLLQATLRRLVHHGQLTVRTPSGKTYRCTGQTSTPRAAVAIRTAAAERRLLLDPGVALADFYMDGTVTLLDGTTLHDLLDLAFLNVNQGGGNLVEAAMKRLRRSTRLLRQINPAGRARRNVAHHYDLDGRLYAQFLDEQRFYSCAYFPTGAETLEQAQAEKVALIARKLHLDRPGLSVLDIGAGWGGLALALARDHGARVTGITLSTEQLAYARARAEAEGLADRVTFLLMDYRSWSTPVDRIVSVGMFEHVGLAHFGAFFRTLAAALRPDGVALLHAIGRAHGPGVTNPWLARHIFPGGYAPALSEILPHVERAKLWVTDVEVLRLHYARTLALWRQRFAANRDAIAALYDERFCRMFEIYLAGSELTFRHADHMVWQLQLTRSVDALPLTRGYMSACDR